MSQPLPQFPFGFPYFPMTPYVMYTQYPINIPAESSILENTEDTRKYKRVWKRGEIKKLYDFASNYAANNGKTLDDLDIGDYTMISAQFGHTTNQCMKKLLEIKANGTLRPGAWSSQEDERLIELIKEKDSRWGEIALALNLNFHSGIKLRSGKQCKERWNNHLNPAINRGPWTKLEDISLLSKFKKHGNKWSKIAKTIPDRTESNIKNRITSLLNKENQLVKDANEKPIIDQLIMKLRMDVSVEMPAVTEDVKSVSPASGRITASEAPACMSFAGMTELVCNGPKLPKVQALDCKLSDDEKPTPGFSGAVSFSSLTEFMSSQAN